MAERQEAGVAEQHVDADGGRAEVHGLGAEVEPLGAVGLAVAEPQDEQHEPAERERPLDVVCLGPATDGAERRMSGDGHGPQTFSMAGVPKMPAGRTTRTSRNKANTTMGSKRADVADIVLTMRRGEGDGVAAGHRATHRAEPAEHGGDERLEAEDDAVLQLHEQLGGQQHGADGSQGAGQRERVAHDHGGVDAHERRRLLVLGHGPEGPARSWCGSAWPRARP